MEERLRENVAAGLSARDLGGSVERRSGRLLARGTDPDEQSAGPPLDAAAEAPRREGGGDVLPESFLHPPPDRGALDPEPPVPDDDAVHAGESPSRR